MLICYKILVQKRKVVFGIWRWDTRIYGSLSAFMGLDTQSPQWINIIIIFCMECCEDFSVGWENKYKNANFWWTLDRRFTMENSSILFFCLKFCIVDHNARAHYRLVESHWHILYMQTKHAYHHLGQQKDIQSWHVLLIFLMWYTMEKVGVVEQLSDGFQL